MEDYMPSLAYVGCIVLGIAMGLQFGWVVGLLTWFGTSLIVVGIFFAFVKARDNLVVIHKSLINHLGP